MKCDERLILYRDNCSRAHQFNSVMRHVTCVYSSGMQLHSMNSESAEEYTKCTVMKCMKRAYVCMINETCREVFSRCNTRKLSEAEEKRKKTHTNFVVDRVLYDARCTYSLFIYKTIEGKALAIRSSFRLIAQYLSHAFRTKFCSIYDASCAMT